MAQRLEFEAQAEHRRSLQDAARPGRQAARPAPATARARSPATPPGRNPRRATAARGRTDGRRRREALLDELGGHLAVLRREVARLVVGERCKVQCRDGQPRARARHAAPIGSPSARVEIAIRTGNDEDAAASPPRSPTSTGSAQCASSTTINCGRRDAARSSRRVEQSSPRALAGRIVHRRQHGDRFGRRRKAEQVGGRNGVAAATASRRHGTLDCGLRRARHSRPPGARGIVQPTPASAVRWRLAEIEHVDHVHRAPEARACTPNAASRIDLPMPGSPRTTTARPRRALMTRSRNVASIASSGRRPTRRAAFGHSWRRADAANRLAAVRIGGRDGLELEPVADLQRDVGRDDDGTGMKSNARVPAPAATGCPPTGTDVRNPPAARGRARSPAASRVDSPCPPDDDATISSAARTARSASLPVRRRSPNTATISSSRPGPQGRRIAPPCRRSSCSTAARAACVCFRVLMLRGRPCGSMRATSTTASRSVARRLESAGDGSGRSPARLDRWLGRRSAAPALEDVAIQAPRSPAPARRRDRGAAHSAQRGTAAVRRCAGPVARGTSISSRCARSLAGSSMTSRSSNCVAPGRSPAARWRDAARSMACSSSRRSSRRRSSSHCSNAADRAWKPSSSVAE